MNRYVVGIVAAMFFAMGMVNATVTSNNNHYPGCTVVVSGENAANTAVQSAINSASPGSTICLTAGVYPEQIVITKALTLEGVGYSISSGDFLGLKGVAALQPTTLTSTTLDFDNNLSTTKGVTTYNPQAPIILVKGTAGVTIENLEVNGTKMESEITSCGATSSNPEPIGILFQSASGTVDLDLVLNVSVTPASGLFGCQTDAGLGIEVETQAYKASVVSVTSSYITKYQKNGITCDDRGTICSLNHNVVVGLGPTPLTAQNGVQIAFGASGIVYNSTVSGNQWTGSGNTGNYLTAVYMAGGILIYNNTGVLVADNLIQDNDVNVWAAGDYVHHLPGAVIVNDNKISGGDLGMVFDSIDGVATNNTVSDTPVGLLATTYANFNTQVLSVCNTYKSVGIDTWTPQPNPPYKAVLSGVPLVCRL